MMRSRQLSRPDDPLALSVRGWSLSQRPLLWLATGFVCISGLLVGATLWVLRVQAIESGSELTASYAHRMEEQTSGALQSVDQCLQLGASGMAQLAASDSLTVASANALMRERIKGLPFVRALWVVNAQGRILYDSDAEAVGLETGDRDYFTIYRTHPQTGFNIGAPVHSRSSGKWIITASRPLHGSDGSFAGIIVAAVSPNWFNRLWETTGLGAGSSAALIRRDGVLMMRSPFNETSMGKAYPNLPQFAEIKAGTGSGTFEQTSPFDGVHRHYAYRTMATHPDLFLVVGQPQSLILAQWYKIGTPLVALWAAASVLIALLAFYLDRGAGLRIRTERSLRESEGRLRDSEENLAITLNSIGDAVIATDTAGLVTRMNPTAERLTGWSLSQALGHPLPEVLRIINAQTGQPAADPVQLVLERGAVVGMANHTVLLARDGREYQIADSAAPIRNDLGQIAGVVLVFSDVTEKYRTAEALAKTTASLEQTGSLAKVGGWEVDLQTMKLTWTKETFRIAGIESLIEPPLEEGINLFAPEARPTISAAVQAAMDLGEPYDLELPIIAANGQPKWVRTQGFADMRDGKATRIFGTFQDITARKAAEAALRERDAFLQTIVDTVPGMLAYWNADLTCRFANSAYQTWFGRAPSEIKGIGMQELLGDALFQKNEPFVRGVLSGENQQFERMLTKVNGDVAYTWAQYIAHWKDGEVVGFLALVTEITETKKVEQRLALALQDKNALLREVHHRVKNNLQVIASLLRLESRRSPIDNTKVVLGEMQARIRAMALLHESLYRSGTFASVDLGNYLRQLSTQAFQTQSTASGAVRLALNLGSVQIGMDQAISCGLLVNELISNCLKHGFPSGETGLVSIDLQPLDTPQQWRLQVCDTGMGLPENFEDKRKGSLGLQLVSDLATQLNGELSITPNPDKGVTFSVAFHVIEPNSLVENG